MMKGWFKVYRSLEEHWLSQDMEKLGRWTWLLSKAAHDDTKVILGHRVIYLKRGQLIASLSDLEKKWKVNRRTVMRFLDVLESEQMLHRQVHQNVTIITICNYASYQDSQQVKYTDEYTDRAPVCTPPCTLKQEYKEDKNIYNTTTTHAHTREGEDEYVRRYREEGLWREVALILHLKSTSECEELFDRWLVEYQHKGQTHQDYSDFKSHFIQWARITISKEKSNGNNNKQNQRRGVQVVANSPEDYKTPF